MTDPSDALPLFQQSLLAGQIPLERGKLDKRLFVATDVVNGRFRLSYLRLHGTTITALIQFVALEPLEGVPCFQLGYAVPKRFRGQGIAKLATQAALGETIYGFGRAGIPEFYVEAVVSPDNKASQRIAAALLTELPTSLKDSVSGEPAMRYLRLVRSAAS